MKTNKDIFSLPSEWISEESKQIVQSCREIVEKEIFPVRDTLDEDWKDHKLYEPLLKKLMLDFGWQCAPWPKEYGGFELDTITYNLCQEEMNRGDSGLATAADCGNWAFLPILAPKPNEVLIKKFAPLACQTDKLFIGCAAITDERSGSDVENIDGTHGKYISTTAVLDGDEWVINGHKLWPTNSGGVADLFAVFCTTNPGVEDDESFAIIYVPADTPGVKQGEAVLRDLASHPSTARFISTKLARHFIADDPPEQVIDRLSKVFPQSGGDCVFPNSTSFSTTLLATIHCIISLSVDSFSFNSSIELYFS